LNNPPKLVCCNFITDLSELKSFAETHGFQGIEWSFTRATLPQSPEAEAELIESIATLAPMEIRYHCAFRNTDLGDVSLERSREAGRVFRQVCRLVSKLGGKVITIHVGLGLDSTLDLSWDNTLNSLNHLGGYAQSLGIQICLENLAWGWSSRPELFEKLIRKSGVWATLDLGHAFVSHSILSQQYDFADFIAPHPERFLGAHIYHEEQNDEHIAPSSLSDIHSRLDLLRELPNCKWWVLELREQASLLQTLEITRNYIAANYS